MRKKLAIQKKIVYSSIMEKTIELKEIIRLHTPLAEAGCVSSQQLVINAQVELDEILEAREKQETFCLQNS